MINPDFDSTYVFDIEAFLIHTYPGMDIRTRRAICTLAMSELDCEAMEMTVNAVVADYAMDKLKFFKD